MIETVSFLRWRLFKERYDGIPRTDMEMKDENTDQI